MADGIKRAVDWLSNWLPDLGLQTEETQLFVGNVLRSFFVNFRVVTYNEEAVGHQSGQYSVYDQIACKAYLEQRAHLENVLWQYRKCSAKVNPDSIRILSAKIAELMGSSRKTIRKVVPVERIEEATKEFLSSTRGGAEHFDVDLAKRVIMQTAAAVGDEVCWFPMLYLMTCVAGTSQLFSSSRILKEEAVQKALIAPYHQKTAEWKQRINRIRFLHKLHDLYGLDKDERSNSWIDFLIVHGSVIKSPEEAELWRTVIYPDKQESSSVAIPPIELSLLCNDCLQKCLPIQPERQYGYQGGSVLNKGGYATFLQQYPDALYICAQRVRQRPEYWDVIQKKYLKLWSAIPCNLSGINTLLKQCCEKVIWESIPNASQDAMRDFCQSLHENEVDEKQIASDIEELKILIIETSLRTVLAEQARAVLANIVEEAWNNGSDLKFQVNYRASKKH